MLRKPQPKEAASAVQALLAKSGVTVSRGTALEVVATVEGFSDWNTMAAATDKGTKQLSTEKSDQPLVKKVEGFQVSDGPFDLFISGGYYDTFKVFEEACSLAEVLAGDLDAENYCEIVAPMNKVIAKFVGDHVRYAICFADADVTADDISWENEVDDITKFGHPGSLKDCLEERFNEACNGDESRSGESAYVRLIEVGSNFRVISEEVRHAYVAKAGRLVSNRQMLDNLLADIA